MPYLVGILLLILLTLGWVGISSVEKVADLTEQLYEHPLVVSNAVLRINGNVIAMHRAMKDIVLSDAQEAVNRYHTIVSQAEDDILADFKLVEDKFLGNSEEVRAAKRAFLAWKPTREEVLRLVQEGKRADAARLTQTEGDRKVEEIETQLQTLHDFSQSKSQEFLSAAKETRTQTLRFVWLAAVGALILSGLIAYKAILIEIKLQGEEQNQTILHSMKDGFWVVGNDGRMLEVNERYCEMSGYSRDEFIALRIGDIDVMESSADTAARIERIKKNGSEIFETRHRRKDGSLFDVEMSVSLLPNSGGKLVAFGRDITERKRMERYQQLASEILGILNDPGSFDASLRQIVSAIKRETECDAVGIRLRSGEDYPYFAHDGFADAFLRTENSLLVRNAEGCVCRDENGGIILECTCGLVLAGKTDPSNPFFTPGGSAWTNNSLSMLELPPEQEPRVKPRNNCIHAGYRSMALIPVRTGVEIVGLLQLNHKEKNRFTPGIIQFFEGIGSSIGTALMRKQAEDALRSSQIRYHALMEQSFEALALIDVQTQEVVEVNRRFTELFGYCLPEDEPLYAYDFVLDSKQSLDRIYNVALWDQPVLVPELRRFRHKKGIEVPAERGGTLIVLDGKQYVLASMRDMTEERRRQAELRHDIEFARRVQQGLLPELPESPLVEIRTIYHPSNFVSGDSYHLEWRNDGKILRGFVLDVAGHGLATAIQTSSVNVLLQEPATARLPLLEQLQRVNARAEKYFTDGAYAAILGFELDFSLQELRYVGAGVTQFYVNGQKIETPGMFVGMWDDPEFTSGVLAFSAGDSFYFLTDGFTDALGQPENANFWSPDGKDFDASVTALERLAKNGTLRDDASGVCFQIRGATI